MNKKHKKKLVFNLLKNYIISYHLDFKSIIIVISFQ